jgi:hypothetical protein
MKSSNTNFDGLSIAPYDFDFECSLWKELESVLLIRENDFHTTLTDDIKSIPSLTGNKLSITQLLMKDK